MALTANITFLLGNGPMPQDTLPNSVRVYDKQAGLWVCNPSNRSSPAAESILRHGYRATPVCYLKGEHDPLDVVRVWLEANAEAIENVDYLGRLFDGELRAVFDANRDHLLDLVYRSRGEWDKATTDISLGEEYEW